MTITAGESSFVVFEVFRMSDAGHSRLLGSFLGKHIYSKGMGGNLLRLLQRHRKAFLNDSDNDHFVAQAAANAVTLKNPTLDQFDQAFTSIAGGPPPHFPFPSVRDYYQTMSSHEILEHVQIPYLAINAADDPIVQRVPLHAGDNPFVVMGLTTGGGHLGWFQAGKNGNVDRWTTQPVLDWLKLMGDDVVHDPTPRGNKIFIDNEGWLREEGREDLGCREVSEEENIYGNKGDADVWQGL
jgi:predicted alpha/beta-fold hydrolase